MADTERLLNKAQGDSIISALAQIAANILQVPSEKLIIDWSYTTLPASGDDHTIYAIPTGDADDPWNFYVWNDVDEEWVQFDWTFAVDSALSTTSENPVQNKVVTTALNDKVDKVTGKGLSTNDYTTDEKNKLAGIEAGAQVNPQIDSALSDSSTNAVQNKVVKGALDGKADNADVAGTQTVSGNPITLTDASETYAQGLSVELEPIQEGSGDPSPTNVRPITGYTECNVDDVGFNQWDEEWESGAIDGTDGSKVPASDRIRSANMIPVFPNKKYWLCALSALRVRAYNYDKSYYGVLANSYNIELTIPNDVHYIMFDIANTTYNYDISINYPSTDHNYHAYHSSNVSIQFGQTVYGGSVDFLTGVLTVDRVSADMGTLNWSYQSAQNRFYAKCPQALLPTNDKLFASIVCSQYRLIDFKTLTDGQDNAVIAGIQTTDPYISIRDTAYSDTQTFTTAMNGVQLVYELAEQQTIQLTPQELKLLQGTNNITTNGTTINLDYIPDNSIGDAVKASEEYTDRAVKRGIEQHLEMPYLRILDNDVDTEIKNYQLYYRMIASAYTLVNLAEMLQHRFLFVEIIQNPSGTSNDKLLHSVLIDPRTIDGFEYQMKAGTGDTVCIKTNIAENKLDLYVQSTGTHTSGDPTDYYVTIRLVD